MIEKFTASVPVLGGEEPRQVYVYLPEHEEGERFPVMYLLDGQTAFFDETAPYGESLRLAEILDKLKAKLIVVAVEANGSNRLTEYSPFAFTSPYGNSSGGGHAFLNWLTGTLRPFIDGRYPTLCDRTHTMIAGSSLGGLMALYGLASFPAVFSAALALSPSLWVRPREMGKLLESIPTDAEVYFDYGEKELSNHEAIMESLQIAEKALAASGASFTFRIAKGAVHNEGAWKKRIPSALASFSMIEYAE